MGKTLVGEGCRDYSIVLMCSYDRLVVETENEGRTVRITYENHLPDEDQNVDSDGKPGVEPDTATKICQLCQKIRSLWLLLLPLLILSIIHVYLLNNYN